VALLDDKERMLLLGIAVGGAAVIIGREFLAPLRRVGRPLAKAAVLAGMTAFEAGQESAARLTEHVADLVAEVAVERQQTSQRES
jgi:hypothetical protein